MRIADYFEKAAKAAPDQALVVHGETRLTYGDARSRVHAIAHTLRTAGLEPGAHIGIYSPNDHRLCLVQMGANRADMAWAMAHIGSSLATNAECLDYLDCEWLFFHSRYEADIPALRDQLPKVRGWVCLDAESAQGSSLAEWIADAPAEPFAVGPADPRTTSFLSLTGGTTGASKAVAHTHASTEMMIVSMYSTLGIGPDSRHLVAAPLSHAAGHLSHAFVARGGTNVILPAFEAEAVLATIEREKITHLFMPPTAVYALLAHEKSATTDFSSLRVVVVGAAPMAPEKFRQAVRAFGPVVHDVYGQTETMFPVLVRAPRDYLTPDGGVDEAAMPVTGRPVPLVDLEIMDDDGRMLPAGEPGEIVVRTSMLMREYYKKPEETAEASKGGWHHTGDIGVRDERGFITVVDRKKDLIISGGFNVYPTEIEAVILSHDAVQECAVVGAPHEKWGEAVTAVVACKPGREVSEADLIDLCKTALGSVKAPKRVEFWPELPHSNVGKILKKDIRSRFWVGRERQI